MDEFLASLMNNGSVLALPVALAVGLVSGLNPCCLPLYPAAAGCCAALRRDSIRGNLGVATAFVLGGAVVTTILGIIAGFAGQMFQGVGGWPAYLIAAIPIIFGLHLMGVVTLPLPSLSVRETTPRGPLGAVALGAAFGLIVTPCATPVLAGLLAYVASSGNPAWGGVLLFVYGIGLGLPILLVGTAAASFVTRLSSERLRPWVEHGTGAVLIGVGLYLVWIA